MNLLRLLIRLGSPPKMIHLVGKSKLAQIPFIAKIYMILIGALFVLCRLTTKLYRRNALEQHAQNCVSAL